MKINELDKAKLGHKLIMLVLSAHQLDIEVKPTITRNLEINCIEQEYIRDLLTMSTDEMIEKWFGGRNNAQSIIAKMFGEAMREYYEKAP